MKAPERFNGKHKIFEETFRAVAKPTEKEALMVLEWLRANYDISFGWIEIDAHIELQPEGYVAVRHHAKYR